MLINGLKISGNAEHVYKNRVLHHGTLLFLSLITHLRAHETVLDLVCRLLLEKKKQNTVAKADESTHTDAEDRESRQGTDIISPEVQEKYAT